MGYLGDDWWARKHTNSLSRLQAGLQGLGGKLENLSAKINIYLEIRRSIAKQSVKVVIPGKKEHGKGSGNYCLGRV